MNAQARKALEDEAYRMMAAAPAMLALIEGIMERWPQMEPKSPHYEEEINGGDCVEWLGELMEECRAVLKQVRA